LKQGKNRDAAQADSIFIRFYGKVSNVDEYSYI